MITVSVSEVEELQRQQVRVNPDGTIGLPLVGIMEVSGMSENGLRSALIQRLAPYVKFPRVELFVERYQARDVAVMVFAGLLNKRLAAAMSNVLGQVQATTYDILDRATNSVDVNGVTITNAFDNLNRLLTRGYPDGGVEKFVYTANIAGVTSYTNQLGSKVGTESCRRLPKPSWRWVAAR